MARPTSWPGRRSTASSWRGSSPWSATPCATSRWPCATRGSGPWCSLRRPEGGGAALVAAVTPDSGLDASGLLEDAKKLIKGGGGKDPILAVAGGKDADGIDAALDTVRAAAGLGRP